jgi:hypothetical protein
VGEKPQRAGRRQDQAQGIRPHNPLDLTALILADAVKGITIAEGDLHRPAVPILLQDGFQTEREVSGKERFDPRPGVPRPGLTFAGRGRAAHHHPQPAPGEHGVPQPLPRLDQRAGFGQVRLPAPERTGNEIAVGEGNTSPSSTPQTAKLSTNNA